MAEPGKIRCPECGASFEIDDRAECLFAEPQSLRLPINGTVCRSCGLIQAGNNQTCLFCGGEINTAVH